MSKKVYRIGFIAEEVNDVDTAKVLIQHLVKNNNIGIRKCIGHGCGKVKRKSNSWSLQLKMQGCHIMILIHDLDSRDLSDLKEQIKNALDPCAIKRHLICIPVQEMEAWLLSDPVAIKTAMNLRKIPKIKYAPETINSPKEYLGELIDKASNGETIYLNTKHNSKIAKEISIINIIQKCPSFKPFYDFIQSNINN